MMVVMMATVMEAKREVCTVDVGRRTTSEPEAFEAERWQVEDLVRRHWHRRNGGMVPGSVIFRCGSRDISLLSLDNLRNPYKTIKKMKNEQDDDDDDYYDVENWEYDVLDAQATKSAAAPSPCKSMCVVEVATEKGGAPGIMNLEKKLRRKLDRTLLKLLERPDAAILMSCSNQQYWLIKWSLLRKRLPEFTTAIDTTGMSCGFHPQAVTATPKTAAPAPAKPLVPTPAKPGVPTPAPAPAKPAVPAPAPAKPAAPAAPKA
ncbi:hypothetical protein Pcinc_032460 [Petrolisthes cinctipes]|uniref:Uncharacterized protein n=1 Tax=Petrolisthes cinctipes TaxID=88211 RepID=A0AAE1K0V1_PETCI|nr:hypothetical protein Pcinc_032460 [Petrolisthes cinctipes]